MRFWGCFLTPQQHLLDPNHAPDGQDRFGLGSLEAMGVDVLEEDAARVSPVRWAHVNMLGRYEFLLSEVVAGGDLRPLRDPDLVLFGDQAA